MKDKPFKTYEELVVKLRDEKKLVIAEEDEAKVIALNDFRLQSTVQASGWDIYARYPYR